MKGQKNRKLSDKQIHVVWYLRILSGYYADNDQPLVSVVMVIRNIERFRARRSKASLASPFATSNSSLLTLARRTNPRTLLHVTLKRTAGSSLVPYQSVIISKPKLQLAHSQKAGISPFRMPTTCLFPTG